MATECPWISSGTNGKRTCWIIKLDCKLRRGGSAEAVLLCQSHILTCDAAEQTQTRCTVTPLAARMTFGRSRGHWDCHSDGFVELPPPGLHRDDGAKGGSVPKDGSHELIWHRLSLNTNTRSQSNTLNLYLLI